MTKTSTEELKKRLENLVKQHNEAVELQNECRNQIIAVQAVIADREDGNTNDSNSTDTED